MFYTYQKHLKKGFSVLCKDIHTTAKAISKGIIIDKFYVAELNEKIVGVLAISNCNGLAVMTDSESYKKHFGLIKGIIAKIVLKKEFESKLDYPVTTGYIEFVSVKKEYRRKGIATTLIKESIKLSNYKDVYNNMIKDSKYIDNKELMILPNVVHTDLYYKTKHIT